MIHTTHTQNAGARFYQGTVKYTPIGPPHVKEKNVVLP